MAWVRGKVPSTSLVPLYQVSCRLLSSAVQTVGQAHAHVPGPSAYGPYLYWLRGVYAGQRSAVGWPSHSLAPVGHAVLGSLGLKTQWVQENIQTSQDTPCVCVCHLSYPPPPLPTCNLPRFCQARFPGSGMAHGGGGVGTTRLYRSITV